MATFTAVGDTTSVTVTGLRRQIDVTLSGTYDMVIALQKLSGSAGSGAFRTVKIYRTANATVADSFYTSDDHQEQWRLLVLVDNGGTCTANITNPSGEVVRQSIKDDLGGDLIKFFEGAAVVRTAPVTLTLGATLTEAAHANRWIVLDAGTGFTMTLPAATGTGNEYRFFVKTAVSSGTMQIKVDNSTDVIRGNVYMAQDAGDTVVGFELSGTTDTIQMNGSTRGGLSGDIIRLVDVAPGFWAAVANLSGTGTEATPAAATV